MKRLVNEGQVLTHTLQPGDLFMTENPDSPLYSRNIAWCWHVSVMVRPELVANKEHRVWRVRIVEEGETR